MSRSIRDAIIAVALIAASVTCLLTGSEGAAFFFGFCFFLGYV